MIKRTIVWMAGLLLVILGINFQTVENGFTHTAVGKAVSVCTSTGWDATLSVTNDPGNFGPATLSGTGTALDGNYAQGQTKSFVRHSDFSTASTGFSNGKMVWSNDGHVQTGIGATANRPANCVKPEVKDASADVNTTPGTCESAGTATSTQQNATLDSPLDTSVGTHTASWTSPQGHLFPNGTHHFSKPYTVEGANNALCKVCTACNLPVKDTTAPDTTVCKGILTNGVYNNVLVPNGADCTIVNGYVNGDVNGTGAHSLVLGGTDVRGNVVADDTWNFTMGATNTTCSADPRVGGSVYARGAHNVVLCNLQVCHSVIINHASGRVHYKESRSNRLVVTGNNKFIKDGDPTHHRLDAIRLFDDQYHSKVIKNNKRPVDKRNLVHVGHLGGDKICRLV